MSDARRQRIAELRRIRDEADEEIKRLALEMAADMAGLQGRERTLFVTGLTNEAPGRTVSSMNVDDTGQSEAVKRGIARGRRNHPAQLAFYEHGVTIKDVAAELRETRARVSAWMSSDPEAVRAVPRRHAEYMKRRFKIPLTAWTRIAD